MTEEKKGCLFGWLANLPSESDGKSDTEGPLPYTKREYFFSKAERSFYGVLKDAVGTANVCSGSLKIE